MVAPVDNLTRLSGTLRDRRPHPDRDGWELVVLDVAEVEPVEGRADLLSRRRGETLEVAVPVATLADAVPGGPLSVRARLTPRGVVSEPHRT